MIDLGNGKQFNMSGVRLSNDRLYCEAALVTVDGNIDRHTQLDLVDWPEVAAAVASIRAKVESAAAFKVGIITEAQLITVYAPPPPPPPEEEVVPEEPLPEAPVV